jgi:hypothetical protein
VFSDHILGDNSKIIDAVVDVTNPFEITTFAPQSRDSKYNNHFDYPQLLRLSTPNDVYADAIVSLLVRFLWHYVSVVYESSPQMTNVYQELKIKSNFLGIEKKFIKLFGYSFKKKKVFKIIKRQNLSTEFLNRNGVRNGRRNRNQHYLWKSNDFNNKSNQTKHQKRFKSCYTFVIFGTNKKTIPRE